MRHADGTQCTCLSAQCASELTALRAEVAALRKVAEAGTDIVDALADDHADGCAGEEPHAVCDCGFVEASVFRAALAPFIVPAPTSVVCQTCNDTHTMLLRDRMVACTRCPVPCAKCRQRRKGAPGAFCAVTPCGCTCHLAALKGAPHEPRGAVRDAAWRGTVPRRAERRG